MLRPTPPTRARRSARTLARTGIQAAQAATAAGTWVYSLAYGAATSGACADDTTKVVTSYTLHSDPTRFYSDLASCTSVNPTNNLVSLFAQVGNALSAARLLSMKTQ